MAMPAGCKDSFSEKSSLSAAANDDGTGRLCSAAAADDGRNPAAVWRATSLPATTTRIVFLTDIKKILFIQRRKKKDGKCNGRQHGAA